MIISADTGGTFTDFVYIENGDFKILKVLSTPENPSKAVLKGTNIIDAEGFKELIHGSTVATNAVLERKGAKTAIISNNGFEDIIEIGRQNRPELYNLFVKRPEHLVNTSLRFGVPGRISKKGEIIEAFDLNAAKKVAELIANLKVESVAICFLFSFVNPIHEITMKEVLDEVCKNTIACSMSHEIMPEFREFERCSTTCVNAYVQPIMQGYIGELEHQIGKDNLIIMQSNGGRISSQTASREPVRTILSGPAGGAVGAFEISKAAGYDKIISFDMGGTSTDVSLINGVLPINVESTVSNYPLKVPMIEIHTVGAGGGSIAYIDHGGALKVGPMSAGAEPGPICYGIGENITVTDANLYLGRLISEQFLGGTMPLAKTRLDRFFSQFSKETGLSTIKLAQGICDIANTVMEKAIRVISVDRGYDPSEFTLCSFGGAGGMHACFLADLLNIPRVLIPKDPGILSAKGMLLADCIRDYSKTVMMNDSVEQKQIEKELDQLEEKAILDLAAEGIQRKDILISRFVDMRYKGQSYELIINYVDDMKTAFDQAHEKRYGYSNPQKSCEIVNIRIRAFGKTAKPTLKKIKNPDRNAQICKQAILYNRDCVFEGLTISTPVVDRDRLYAADHHEGPVIIVEYSSTIVIPPTRFFYVDDFGNLIVEKMIGGR
ncbi:MAG TPA: hydantoinase/oxoprolinase family protein [Thermotogota bacterium]|nr:hydantoinase/oxoprolinase family protein [Thermotogota bacterium]